MYPYFDVFIRVLNTTMTMLATRYKPSAIQPSSIFGAPEAEEMHLQKLLIFFALTSFLKASIKL